MNARLDNSGFWILFGLVVYLVPICVYLYQSRWLPRLVAPVCERLRASPRWMLPAIVVFVVQMVVIGGRKYGSTMPDSYPYDLADISYPVAHPTNTWYVSIVGSDANAGTNWNCALATIQGAINKASSNAVINVSAYEGSNVCVYAPISTDNRHLIIQSIDRYGKHRKPIILGDGQGTCANLWNPENDNWLESYDPSDPNGFRDGDFYWHKFSRNSILKGFIITKGTHGVYGGLAIDCVITGNTNWWGWGAGAFSAKLVNCLVYDNIGQGASDSILVNCTITHNYAEEDAALDTWCYAYNCIIWNNTNSLGRVSDISEYYYPVLTPNWMKLWGCHSDMIPQLSTDTWYCEDPKFVDPDNGDYHLSADSPCIDAGWAEYAVAGENTDLDGMLRTRGWTIDPGCYEYVESPTIQSDEPIHVPYWWMWEHGLFAFDADIAAILQAAQGDSFNRKNGGGFYKVWESYVADLDPTDSNQTFLVSIQMTNGVPEIACAPVSPRRRYELMGSLWPAGPWR